jgi:DNA polymerase-3 subunit beta
MQLKQIGRDALLKPLQAVSGIVERRHTLPILANVLLEQRDGRLYVTATDLEMQITAHTEWAGKETQAITVAARKLQDLLRALPEDSTLNIDAAGSKMTVRAGRSRFNLQTLPAADYPRIGVGTDQLQTLTLPQRDLKGLLRSVEFAMAQQDIRYYLNGMLLVVDGTTVRAVATDGHRLALAEVTKDGASGKIEAIIPRKTILELSRLLPDADDPVRVQMAASQVKFTFGDIELISKLVEGKFPDYQRVVPAANTKTFAIGREDLMHALQRAAILTTDKFKGVRMVLGAGSLKINSTNADQEDAQEELEIDYTGDGLDIGFNVNYLLDVLLNLKNEQVSFALGDALGSALITMPDSEKFKYVVMPMRI